MNSWTNHVKQTVFDLIASGAVTYTTKHPQGLVSFHVYDVEGFQDEVDDERYAILRFRFKPYAAGKQEFFREVMLGEKLKEYSEQEIVHFFEIWDNDLKTEVGEEYLPPILQEPWPRFHKRADHSDLTFVAAKNIEAKCHKCGNTVAVPEMSVLMRHHKFCENYVERLHNEIRSMAAQMREMHEDSVGD